MANAVVWAEFKVLTAAQQQNVLNLLSIAGALLSGTDNATKLLPGMILEYFPGGTTTRANLIALAKAITGTWCKAHGYPENPNGGGGLTMIDVQTAGLS